MPDGTVGEIVIGGGGVARGYRKRPELSAERFILLDDGSRAYRTGDLGRIDDGALYCLGRLDDQVKVRGFRIELGDIEAALAHHPAVAWGAVRLWTDPSGEPVLVAYIVPRPGETPSAREVKLFLTTRIASYMIPDRIVSLAAMPLTPNGKIDRAALASPFVLETIDPNPQLDSTIATRLTAIWCDLLGLGAVSEQDDFFDLGGYSLMTVRLTRRIEAEFGVKLALIELMQHSTLGTMSARIALGQGAKPETTMLLNAGGDRPPLFWLDAGPLMRTIMRGLSPGQPAFALNTDPGDEEAFGDGDLSIPAIAAYLREKLIAEQPSGPYYIGGWCRWGIVAFELARQLRESGERVALLTLLDAERPSGRVQWGIRRRVKAWLRAAAMPTAIEAPPEPRSFSQRVELATRDYVAGPYDGDVLLLRPEGAAGDAGWGAVVTGRVEVARVPGDHVSMVRGASALALAAHIDKALRAAQHELADLSSGRQRDPVFDRGLAEQTWSEGAHRRPDVVAG